MQLRFIILQYKRKQTKTEFVTNRSEQARLQATLF